MLQTKPKHQTFPRGEGRGGRDYLPLYPEFRKSIGLAYYKHYAKKPFSSCFLFLYQNELAWNHSYENVFHHRFIFIQIKLIFTRKVLEENLFCTKLIEGTVLRSPRNIKGANKDAKIYVGRSTTLHNLLFCPHTLCMNYVTNTFLLVSSSISSKQQLLLWFVQSQGQKTEQWHTTKNFD